MTSTPFPLGSISSGTLRMQDLVSAFAAALDADCDLAIRVKAFDPKSASDAEAYWLLEELENALDEIAPPFCYFGTAEGDGADFGFWPEYDLIREALAGGDLLQVTDIREIPTDYDGQALRVRDGYMTLFAVVDGNPSEIWTTYAPDPA